MKLNKLVSTLDMDHETWLQYRKKGVGRSDGQRKSMYMDHTLYRRNTCQLLRNDPESQRPGRKKRKTSTEEDTSLHKKTRTRQCTGKRFYVLWY